MRSNAVIPPEMVKRIAQWDGESGRDSNLIVSGRTAVGSEKDHRALLHAMTLLRTARPWRLAIVGDGPERAALEAFVHTAGFADRVIFTGYVDDPFAWTMRASLAVCSSIYEGLCNALVEALVCDAPVVSTPVPMDRRKFCRMGVTERLCRLATRLRWRRKSTAPSIALQIGAH